MITKKAKPNKQSKAGTCSGRGSAFSLTLLRLLLVYISEALMNFSLLGSTWGLCLCWGTDLKRRKTATSICEYAIQYHVTEIDRVKGYE